MARVTERVRQLFETQSKRGDLNNAELLARYNPNMELQINVSSEGGEPVEGKHNAWTDGEHEWWHIRIPKKAMTEEPIWHDYELNWSLEQHAEAIGMTGWDWASKRSKWVAFDFDAITGHAAGVGVTKDELQNVQEAACAIPWVEVRLSTRGKGLHLYVYFCDPTDPENIGVPTKTHTHHQALAKTVLGMMSQHAGFDFSTAIDACGGNMWVWHRDATKQNHGYTQVKAASSILHPNDLPEYWEDNIEVVTRRRAKQRVRGIEAHDEDEFDVLANSRSEVKLTPEHDEVINDLGDAGYSAIWHQDYRLLQTHTHGLKLIMQKNPGKYNGFFDTLSEGGDPGKPNCFGFPLPGRGWKFYRFGKDVREHESWERQDNGWVATFFDRKPTLDVAARIAGGSELSEGGYAFDTLEEALRALKMLGVDFEINIDRYGDRKSEIKVSKREGRVVLRMKQLSKDEHKPGANWNEKRGGWWETIVRGVETSGGQDEVDYERWDKICRCTNTPNGEQSGWYIWDSSGTWVRHPLIHVQKVLGKNGLKAKEQDDYLGYAVQTSWSLVNLPFQPEYPGQRQWNFKSAQWKFQPAQLDFDQAPQHPHWDQILDHIGQDLDQAVREHPWGIKYGVRTGRHYLQLWIASLLRHPFDKLPYLFLFSRDENTGKSTLHQAIARLITGGVEFADRALKGDNDFNGELANCVLAVIEEVSPHGKDVARARARMKDWTTNDFIAIRAMRTDVFRQRNTLHFIQCSNNREDCMVSFGDTRTTMIHVPSLAASERAEIPHAVLMQRLDEEAPHFMRTLCDLEIPPPESRLRVPYINTSSKRRYEEEQRTDLEVFIQERCVYKPGASVPWRDFYNAFVKTLAEEERGFWSKKRVSMSLPDHFPTGGFDAKNTTFVGNLLIDPKEPPTPDELRRAPLIRDKGRLKLREGNPDAY